MAFVCFDLLSLSFLSVQFCQYSPQCSNPGVLGTKQRPMHPKMQCCARRNERTITVAILAQGTSWAVSVTQAFCRTSMSSTFLNLNICFKFLSLSLPLSFFFSNVLINGILSASHVIHRQKMILQNATIWPVGGFGSELLHSSISG